MQFAFWASPQIPMELDELASYNTPPTF